MEKKQANDDAAPAERKTNDAESKPKQPSPMEPAVADFLRKVNLLPYRKQSMETAWAAINAASDVIRSLHAPAPAPPVSELQKALVEAMVKKLSADPLEGFVRMAALMRESRPAAIGTVAGSAEDKLLSLLIERAFSPPAPPSNPVAGLGAELERTLPLLTPFITEAIQSWGRISEARRAIRQAQADSTRPGNQAGSST